MRKVKDIVLNYNDCVVIFIFLVTCFRICGLWVLSWSGNVINTSILIVIMCVFLGVEGIYYSRSTG